MDVRILGPLQVWAEGRRLELGPGRQRALFALLVLHANEPISADRLIDHMWGERAPATAAKVVQGYVSQLRKALPEDTLVTRAGGYLLRVADTDAAELERLVEQARTEDAAKAARTLREALELWRGRPLADFEYEDWAQAEISRLEELRLAAVEDRIEAELQLGRHAALVPELERLVVEHPLRERLRGQLVLALYRSGRQADALDAYSDGRRRLVDQLGIEPGPELQDLQRRILAQDPELSAASPSRPLVARRRAVALLVAGAALVLAAAVAAGTTLWLSGGGEAEATGEGALQALDPRTGELLDPIPLGRTPSVVAVGEGAVWVLDADDRTVSRVDRRTGEARTFSTGSTPTDLSIGGGGVWVGNAFRTSGFGNYPASVSRLDPESGVVDRTVRLPTRGASGYLQGGGFAQQLVAATDGAVWAVNPDQTVSRIDPRTNKIVARIGGVRATSIAADGGEVWAVDKGGVAEIDPRTNAVSRRIEVAAGSLTGIVIGGGALWVADPFGGSVWRIDPDPEPRLRTIPLDFGVSWVAAGEGAVWATNELADKVYRIDPRTNRSRVVARLGAPTAVALGDQRVWVTVSGTGSPDAALPASACGEVFYRGTDGAPRFLIVSDLPLQGGPRAYTLPMVEAIRFVLRERGFKVGPYTVGYQSCDDSTAQSGTFDIYRCFANGKAYARTPDVIGVIGAFDTFCSIFEIPTANQADGGPLAMISPSNTLKVLTRPGRGRPPGELAGLYPRGVRNYVRIAAADHLAATALVDTARQLRRRRAFLAWAGQDPDAADFAADMRQAARARGIAIVGAAAWNPDARRFTGLARRIAAVRPDAVLMAGGAPRHFDALLRDLRARLSPKVALIAGDGFAGFQTLMQKAGRAADGMYVGNYGIPNAKLPPRGRRFLAELEAAGGHRGPDASAAYAGQAAEILLDAIARSDGTRASVTRELRRTRVEDGILGDIRFDRYGDLVEGPVTIYRIAGKRAVVDRVVTARTPDSGRIRR